MTRLLHREIIDGHELCIRQEMIDLSDTAWGRPFMPGLKFATVDDRSITLSELRTFLTTTDRGDLIVQFQIPEGQTQ